MEWPEVLIDQEEGSFTDTAFLGLLRLAKTHLRFTNKSMQ